MSSNQPRADRSDSSQYKRRGRSASFSKKKCNYSASSGKGDGAAAPPQSSNLQPNRSFGKKSYNAQGGQSRAGGYAVNLKSDPNSGSAIRPAPHLQPPVPAADAQDTSSVVKPTTELPAQRSAQVVTNAPSQIHIFKPEVVANRKSESLMSFNQPRADRSDSSQHKRRGRSASFSKKKCNYSASSGKGDGAAAPPQSSNLQPNRSFGKKSYNAQGGQSRAGGYAVNLKSDPNSGSAIRPAPHLQPPVPAANAQDTSSVVKPTTELPAQRSAQVVTNAPSQAPNVKPDPVPHATPTKVKTSSQKVGSLEVAEKGTEDPLYNCKKDTTEAASAPLVSDADESLSTVSSLASSDGDRNISTAQTSVGVIESVDSRPAAKFVVSDDVVAPVSIISLPEPTSKSEKGAKEKPVANLSRSKSSVTKGKKKGKVAPVSIISLPEPTLKSEKGAKETPVANLSRSKSSVTKGKKKGKAFFRKADSAGTTDLYMAYKVSEEKKEIVDDSDTKEVLIDSIPDDVDSNENVEQGKAEPDDWEDAADNSTPKLEAVDKSNKVSDDDGTKLMAKKYTRDFLMMFSEQCINLPDSFEITSDLADAFIRSPHTHVPVMHKAERKFQVGKITDEEEVNHRQLKSILNKLSPQNFDKLFEQVKAVVYNFGTLIDVISQIFDKALMEPAFCEMCADLCYHLAGELPDFSEDNEKITFKRLLINMCQEEFERGEREQEEAERADAEGEVQQSPAERERKRIQARRRKGNIRLIGELYKKRVLNARIMHDCIKKLLGQYDNPDEEDIESLCKLLSKIGERIDNPEAKEYMDAYFDMMSRLSNNMQLSSRVRFMLKDAIDLRKNKWQRKRKVKGPKKIKGEF